MNHYQKFLSLFLVLIFILSPFSACGKKNTPVATETNPAETEAAAEQETSAGYYQIGDKMEDFIITTYDGKEVSLYKLRNKTFLWGRKLPTP